MIFELSSRISISLCFAYLSEAYNLLKEKHEEYGINLVTCGHHRTETFGVCALAKKSKMN